MSFNSLVTSPSASVPYWRVQNLYAVPNGSAAGGRAVDPRKTEEGGAVLNAIYPYTKSYGIYQAAGLSSVPAGLTQQAGAKPMVPVGVTYNGLLHGLGASGVDRPANCPLFWMGRFKQNDINGTINSPNLLCGGSKDCQFNASGYPQSAGAMSLAGAGTATISQAGYGYVWYGGSNDTLFVYGKGMPWIFTDTSAKFINYGNMPLWPSYGSSTNAPWSSMDPNGIAGAPYWTVDCVRPGGTKGTDIYYWGYFRPDNDGSLGSAQCDVGGG